MREMSHSDTATHPLLLLTVYLKCSSFHFNILLCNFFQYNWHEDYVFLDAATLPSKQKPGVGKKAQQNVVDASGGGGGGGEGSARNVSSVSCQQPDLVKFTVSQATQHGEIDR